jgi:hypothetical protein
MEWIKEIIGNQGRFSKLLLYTSKIEDSLNTNPNETIEVSKALIETICKTINKDLGHELTDTRNFPEMVRETLLKIPFIIKLNGRDAEATEKVCKNVLTLCQGLSEFRNNHGFSSHGQDIEEEQADITLAKLIYKSTDVIGGFLLEIHTNFTSLENLKRLYYEDYPDFNEWYDELYGQAEIGQYNYPSSEALYKTDIEAYKQELIGYIEDQKNSDSQN